VYTLASNTFFRRIFEPMAKDINTIGVFTSGGDAPGMNAAVRAVVRAAIYYKKKVIGIRRGYEGMLDKDFYEMNSRSVSNIIQRGGTILKSARSERFMTVEGRKQAHENLVAAGIDGFVAIGGDGTFRGATKFYEEFKVPSIGIPGTIDNDINGTDYTLGYDTASNTAVQAIDSIRDTASSHSRLFFIEVMGRDTGFIAVRSALAAGAEAFLIPEKKMELDQLIKILDIGHKNKKSSSLVVVAEGNRNGNAMEIAKLVTEQFNNYDAKVTVLGHLQRGGTPTTFDRVLASRLGVAAVEALIDGMKNVMVGRISGNITYVPLNETSKDKGIDNELMRIAGILAT